MKNAILEIFRYRDLLYMLTVRDIRIRYKQAAMGFLWAIFMPFVAVAAGILIKKAMAVVAGERIAMIDLASISVKVLPWMFFISSLRFSMQSLVGNSMLVTKIYFPKAVLPLASVAACFFDFVVATGVVVVILTIVKLGISLYLLWLLVLAVFLILLTAGLGLLLSAANLFYRDVKYIVEIVLMYGIFFTPVYYEASHFGNWKILLLLNPIGSILESVNRVVVLKEVPDPFWLTYAGLCSIGVFILGLYLFHRKEPEFAENI